MSNVEFEGVERKTIADSAIYQHIVQMADKHKAQREELLAVLVRFIDAGDSVCYGNSSVSELVEFGEADDEARTIRAKVEKSL